MPERALLRLRRAEIPLFGIKKVAKNRILFRVKKKDCEKVFAIYPNMCYNNSANAAYKVKALGAEGVGKYLEKAKDRVGLLLGGLLCFVLVNMAQPLVLSVEFIGTSVYKREALQTLEEVGIRQFAPYTKGKEDLVCAKLLALDGVEYCSVKKTGNRVAVEMRLSPFPSATTDKGNMQAKHSGEIVAMTVLRGSPLKKIGDTVRAGDTLVENCFFTEQGGQVRVEIIARVCIACAWEGDIEAEDEESAFAKAYLALGLTAEDTLQKIEVAENGALYRVKLAYQAVERINF